MVVKNASGTVMSKSALEAALTTVTQPAVYQVPAGVTYYKTWTPPGTPDDSGKKIALVGGQQVTQAQIDALYKTPTVTSITPNTGPHGSTTAVVIKGTNLGGSTGVSFGANAGTGFSAVNEETINVTAPTAAAAGTVDVIVHDDSGDFTVTGGFVYS